MADKITSTLSNTVVTTVVTALAESLTQAKNSGTALLGFCTAAAKAKLPKTPNEADVVAIVDALAAKLNWNGTPREKVSKSEARNIVRQHAYLPELMTALRSSPYGACGYHDAVKLCRLMKSEGSVGAAVLKFTTKGESKPVDTFASMVSAVQRHYQSVSEEKPGKIKTAKLSAMRQLAEAMGFDIVKEAIKEAA